MLCNPTDLTSLITRRVHEIDQRRTTTHGADGCCWRGTSRRDVDLDAHERLRLPRQHAVREGPGRFKAVIDYAHESGFYVGAWSSNIDFGVPAGGPLEDPGLELDVYAGFTKTLEGSGLTL